jgi:hypothetical protein
MNRFLLLSFITLSLSSSAHAIQDAQELLFDDPVITETTEPVSPQVYQYILQNRRTAKAEKQQAPQFQALDLNSMQGFGSGIGKAFDFFGDIVNLGKLAWEIIDANRPVASLNSDWANAIPRGTESWKDLSGWSMPQSKTFNIDYKNKFGGNVASFKYQLIYSHGGNIKGIGRYLANITVIPAYISVKFGFKLNATATVPQVTNVGSYEMPVAGAQVLMKWRLDSLIQSQQVTKLYSLTGSGDYKEVNP